MENFVTIRAHIQSLSRPLVHLVFCKLMSQESFGASKHFLALITWKFFPCMRTFMVTQCTIVGKLFATMFALIFFLTSVDPLMKSEVCYLGKSLPTSLTHMRSLSSVRSLVLQ